VPVPLGLVQTDLTCEGCGYNLYSQPITRDERLGIPVCRCPECGRFNVPGKATDASRAWLRRLGVGLLVLYVLAVLWVIGLAVTGLAALQHEYLSGEVRERVYGQGRSRDAAFELMYWLGTAALGFTFGMFLALVGWHWKRRWALLVAALPFVVAPLVYMSWLDWLRGWGDRPEVLRWGRTALALHASLGAASIALGLLWGRAVARGVLRALLPPGPRVYLAFLWYADGKTPPVTSD
jgi:hypothetical protein